jgi:hypothetical protein
MFVWIVTPDGYEHSHAFDHIAESFSQSMGCMFTTETPDTTEKVVVLGPHLLPEVKAIWPKNMILFNSEQLSREWFSTHSDYLKILKSGCYEVWDYSKNNIAELARNGVVARHVEIGWMPCMSKDFSKKKILFTRTERNEDIDVLFYGSRNERRAKILRILQDNCNLHVVFNMYGKALDDVIARSKIILNMHFYETGIHEIFRTSYLMANRKCVVTEKGKDLDLEKKYYKSMWFSDYEALASECLNLLANKRARDDVAECGFRTFTKLRQDKILERVS